MLTPNNRLHSYAIPVAGLATVRRHVEPVEKVNFSAKFLPEGTQ